MMLSVMQASPSVPGSLHPHVSSEFRQVLESSRYRAQPLQCPAARRTKLAGVPRLRGGGDDASGENGVSEADLNALLQKSIQLKTMMEQLKKLNGQQMMQVGTHMCSIHANFDADYANHGPLLGSHSDTEELQKQQTSGNATLQRSAEDATAAAEYFQKEVIPLFVDAVSSEIHPVFFEIEVRTRES